MKSTPNFLLCVGIILLCTVSFSLYEQQRIINENEIVTYSFTDEKELLKSSIKRIDTLNKIIHCDKYKGTPKSVCFFL